MVSVLQEHVVAVARPEACHGHAVDAGTSMPLAVLGIASVYGKESMLTHPALVRLRTGPGHLQPQEGPRIGSR